MNTVIVTGRLTKDIELGYSMKGNAYANTSLAINEHYTDQTGKRHEKTTFIDIKFYNRYAEIANDLLQKGDKVLIRGSIQQEKWVNQQGENRQNYHIYVEKFELLQKKYVESNNNNGNSNVSYNNYHYDKNAIDVSEDSIPF